MPTEAQWEKAARGTDGCTYPWGNQSPNQILANFDSHDTTEVGQYPAGTSPYGALDMAGNVFQWVADWYDENYYINSPAKNPTGPTSGYERVVRGGAWFYTATFVRSAARFKLSPNAANDNSGFRCSRSP